MKRRFVKKLYIPLPNKEAREELIKTVIRTEGEQGNYYNLSQEVSFYSSNIGDKSVFLPYFRRLMKS